MSSIRPRGNRWYYLYYFRGKLREKSTGIECRDLYGRLCNRRLAKKVQAQWDFDRKQPGWQPDQWEFDQEPVTLDEFIAEDRQHLNSQGKRYKRTTLVHYSISYQHIKKCFPGNTLLTEITQKRVERELLPLLYHDYKWNTVRGTLIDLRAAFNRALRWGYLDDNPFSGINTRRKKTRPQFYSLNDIDIMRGYFLQPGIPPWQGDIVFLSLNTGLRRQEAVLLDWNKHVHLNIGALAIPGKGDKERVIPLNDEAIGILTRRPRHIKNQRVFWEIKNFEAYKSAFDRMKQRTGLTGNIHQLRKTFASHWAMNGGNPYKLMDILGHESLSTVMIYYSLSPESLQAGKEHIPHFRRQSNNTPMFGMPSAESGGDTRK